MSDFLKLLNLIWLVNQRMVTCYPIVTLQITFVILIQGHFNDW